MKFIIKHELPGRLRIHLDKKRLSFRDADILEYCLKLQPAITEVKIYERTADAVIRYKGERNDILCLLKSFSPDKSKVQTTWLDNSSRASNAEYYEKIVTRTVVHFGKKIIMPLSIKNVMTAIKSLKFLWRAVKTIPHKNLEVPVLDAVAIYASMMTGDFSTASSVMFLLNIGDTIEEWTHKKSVDDLARRMSLNISSVWLLKDGAEIQIDAQDVREGDHVVVRMGSIVPFDGEVVSGDAMINQAAMTGEAVPVRKDAGKSVYAGTVVEEGEIVICVKKAGGDGRFDRIVSMIEDSEKLKSMVESRAEHLADRLVPYTFGAAALCYLVSKNVNKSVSVLMVDYSCALKLTIPLSVLTAISEAADRSINVKGGKYLEAVAEADTIVFDKTGTLTKAQPTVADVISFNGESVDELLREAACLEEHFPHSIANAIVDAAYRKGLHHDELHSKVEYIVAHGIATTIEGKRATIGSYHFIFEDEGVRIPDGKQELFESLPTEYSQLYYAKEGMLAAVILIEDPLREEAKDVIRRLKSVGFTHAVMMTGDSEKTARVIADKVGIDEYYSEVLPEDKAGYVEKVKAAGHKVIMVGDGINDSPALSAADVGIAINEGSDIARQIADITIGADSLESLIELKLLSKALMDRIRFNYRTIISFNSSLILLGLFGIITPSVSALLHNSSTIALGLKSMQGMSLALPDKTPAV